MQHTSTCVLRMSRKAQIVLVYIKIFCMCAAHICSYVDNVAYMNHARIWSKYASSMHATFFQRYAYMKRDRNK